MNNIKKFNDLIISIQGSIKILANLYHEDTRRMSNAEERYLEKTNFTRTMLRRLCSIARGDLLPETFYISNSTAYSIIKTMGREQQKEAIHGKVKVVSEDGTHWLKKFEDLSPRQMHMIYNTRSKAFRSEDGQRDWLNSNPVIKVSDGKGKILEVVKDNSKDKIFTKAKLIKDLKEKGLTAQDLSKLADASTLMAAAQLALIKV